MEERPIIFDIQRFSVHDGPGIRTLVFFKGCPLRCQWCSNPESHTREPQIASFNNRCIGCLRCVEVCPDGAVWVSNKGHLEYDRQRCKECGACVDTCYANARVLLGWEMTVEEIMVDIRKDTIFYDMSGGGVTLGGGEVTMWPMSARKLLAACKAEGIHTAIETCGYAPWSNIECLLEYLDLVFFDIKHLDPGVHYRYTGVNNHLILENLKRLAQELVSIVIRVPVIPGVNNTRKNIRDIAAYVRDQGLAPKIVLLPYHRFGEEKYARLGRTYPLPALEPPDEEEMDALAAVVHSEGLDCQVGG
ncbi:MAG: glycyl-radical enzyme activating protein [Anaerolineae bacterium]|nr:glycyl-radical enzyme activating protein [Anaerolineae bacterium]